MKDEILIYGPLTGVCLESLNEENGNPLVNRRRKALAAPSLPVASRRAEN